MIKKIKEASKLIRSGKLVIYPTDTLYALGCDALNEHAIRRVFLVKKRSFSKPLPIAVHSIEMMERYAYLNEKAKVLIKEFLPGALTIVLKKKEKIPHILTAGFDKVAIRIPANDIALRLIEAAEVPLVATSANISGEPPPASIEKIKIKADYILDGGKLEGIPSTIVDLTEKKPKILRRGMIDEQRIFKVLQKSGRDS